MIESMRWLGRIVRGILLAILVLVCAALFYILVIMGDAPKTEYDASRPTATQVAVWGESVDRSCV